jgi:hypothetical protein
MPAIAPVRHTWGEWDYRYNVGSTGWPGAFTQPDGKILIRQRHRGLIMSGDASSKRNAAEAGP